MSIKYVVAYKTADGQSHMEMYDSSDAAWAYASNLPRSGPGPRVFKYSGETDKNVVVHLFESAGDYAHESMHVTEIWSRSLMNDSTSQECPECGGVDTDVFQTTSSIARLVGTWEDGVYVTGGDTQAPVSELIVHVYLTCQDCGHEFPLNQDVRRTY